MHLLERSLHVPLPVSMVFAFYADALNLEAITPPWLRFRVVTPGPIRMRPGTLIEYRLRVHGLPVRWVTRIEEWVNGKRFVDVQLRGPYRLWHHTHEFEPDGDGTLVRDTVRYALPLGPLGEVVRRTLVARDLERIFAFRQEAVAHRFTK